MIKKRNRLKISKQGFTLLELLIVIAILAVLSTIVVLVLNPAEYLRQARDSQRLSDLKAISQAVNLYFANVSPINLGSCTTVYCTAGTTVPGGTAACTPNNNTAVNATSSWVTVKLSDIPSGSPLAKYPLDPTNDATYHYAYFCSSTSTTYELNANMESQKYSTGGSGDVESNTEDGGSNNNAYETGNAPGLILIP